MKSQYLYGFGKKSRTISFALASIFAASLTVQSAQADALPPVDSTLAALVPQTYRDRGTLTVAVNPDVVPIKFVGDDGEIAGFTPDLFSAAASVLGLKVQFAQTSFDSLIPGMAANRFDVLLSLSDYPERHNMVTFVDYLNMGETIVAAPTTKIIINSNDDLCGLKLAVLRGTGASKESAVISDKCVKDGKKAIEVSTYPDANMALLSLSTGVSEVAWVDSPVGNYNATKFPAKYKVIYFSPQAPYGIGFGVDDKGKQLATAVQQALLKLHKDGTYDSLLKKWGLNAKDAQPDFPINGAKL
ncbi:TPA: ABC transporter substrate-binding protein [Pseudomonas putida]|jgi:polar amino acid transport system substrate-binding protein|uniref:ABC transporter substrate-binding protein n=1 Tax=Pseudomonas putida TaxID=303 RepID=UPI002363B121|nr:ABC transporter substrate-binding protein [Pseudomonas putida]MDD2008329.1 ABC transporter substrate-binding protein [Pseudomonas putida]HDS1775794.1 ABC transporter substrate-binding protein [Pseudomonas putida]